ncbi:hypothetical protein PMZ80_008956 [Knufia obscura]|nr:hypothetical protein PMZ80_008956 [Knufia obscura]
MSASPSGETSTSPSQQLYNFISSTTLNDIPHHLLERSKYLILDGIACALTSAHMYHSELAAKAVSLQEPGNHGTSSVIGHPELKLSPVSAALLNSTWIQGFELDDWHKDAPLHSNSIVIPALMAAAEHRYATGGVKTSGQDFLLAMAVGFEVGPRVGKALWGRHILTEGWHSGAVFGPSAAAAGVSKLYNLDSEVVEDALGIACTQACGLMSAQFESDAKRMQHGFAARNGLFGALMAKEGYTGIKKVYEREYGGFLEMFSKGNGKEPQYRLDEISEGLGQDWSALEGIVVKPYAAMAGTHMTVDCMKALQDEHAKMLAPDNLGQIKSITIRLDEPFFNHGGWRAEKPLNAIGAQMNNAFVGAMQLVERECLAAQFGPEKLEAGPVWDLVGKTTCELGQDYALGSTEVEIVFEDGTSIKKFLDKQKGVDPPMTNEEIVQKYRGLSKSVIEEGRMHKIEEAIVNLNKLQDLSVLVELLTPVTRNPLA